MTTNSVSKEQPVLLPCAFCAGKPVSWPGGASPRPWSYGSLGRDGMDWIKDANGMIFVERVGPIDGPLICEIANASSPIEPGGVTSGEVVTDEMVGRALASIEGEPDLFVTKGAMRWALTAALSSLHAQPEGAEPKTGIEVTGFYRRCSADTLGAEWAEGIGYHVHDERARIEGQAAAGITREKQEAQPQGTGSPEAVAGYLFDLRYGPDNWSRQRMFSTVLPSNPDDARNVEPLVPLVRLQAVERERDEARGKLALIVDRIVYSDSYGVPGSDFMCCHLCSGGGAPGIQFEHDAACPVRDVEQEYEQWWDAQRETEDALRAAEASLAAAREALRSIEGLPKHSREDDGENASQMAAIARAALAGSNPK